MSIDFEIIPTAVLLALIVFGLVALYFGGDWLTDGAAGLALQLKISKLVIGLTVVSVATSAPELFVSMISSAAGSPGIAMGNIVGSNIANISLILGLAALLWPFTAETRLARKEIHILGVVTLLFSLFCYTGAWLGRTEGLILLILMVIYMIYIVRSVGSERRKKAEVVEIKELEEELANVPHSLWKAFLWVASGGAALALGSYVLVGASQEVAVRMGVSEFVIGVTILALGTSLPELAATIAAALKKHSDMVAGNIVGSNLFNILLIGGCVSSSFPIKIDPVRFQWEFPGMLFVTVLLWIFLMSTPRLTRWKGAVLFISYFIIIVYSAMRHVPTEL